MKQMILLIVCAPVLIAADAQLLRVGSPGILNAASQAFTSCTIDSATKKCGIVFQIEATDTFPTALFRYAVRAGTPVEHKISLQAVTTTASGGTPSGTVSYSAAFTPPANSTWDGTIQAITWTRDGAGNALGSAPALAAGDFWSLVIEACTDSTLPCHGAATPDASNNSTFSIAIQSFATGTPALPYALTYSSSWTKASFYLPVYGLRSATKTYGYPIQGVSKATISVGAETAVNFKLPASVASTYKVAGVHFLGSTGGANKTIKILLYSGTTALQSLIWDSDISRTYGASNANVELYFPGTLTALTAGTTYRIGISPQDSVTGIGLYQIDLATAEDRTAFAGGTMFGASSRSGCGSACDATSTAWTDTDTSRPMIELILADLTPPAGGGGGTAHAWVN